MKKCGDHVLVTPGAGEDQVIVHVLENLGDTRLKVQMPGGGTDVFPHRERSSADEDLGRTWQEV